MASSSERRTVTSDRVSVTSSSTTFTRSLAIRSHEADDVRVVADSIGWGRYAVDLDVTQEDERISLVGRVEGTLHWIFGGPSVDIEIRVPPGVGVDARIEGGPLLLEDLTSLLERLAPQGAGYAHDDLDRRADVPPEERPNGHSHAKAALLRTSETLNVVAGSLQLGRWQRVLLVELDGPRSREVSLVALGGGRR